MPPRERTRRAPREHTRREILDAAGRAFARGGFHGTSVEAVAAEAGMSTGAVYSNFKGKEDLFLTLYEERVEGRARQLREAVTGAGGGAAGLASAAANASETFRRDREWLLLYLEFALHAARSPDFARRFRSVRRRSLDELAKGIGEAHAEAADVAPELARAIRAASYGFALERLVGETRGTEEALQQTLAMLFRGALSE